jgi:methyl acetate hydrolase
MEEWKMTRTIAPLILAALLAGCGAEAPKKKPADTEKIDQVLKTAVETKKIPGAVAMVASGDEIVYDRAFDMNKDTIFAIASMTKPVTSVAVMQLVEAGKVKLDDPAATYAPELAKVQVLENGKLRPPKSPPTVRQLLNHTSGFAYEFMDPQLRDYVAKGGVASMMGGGDDHLKAPLMFDPGTRWEYGISTDWLGRIVEKLSGQNLEDYFKTRIFEPLGMKDSFFTIPPDKQARLAPAYRRKADGSLEKQAQRPTPPLKFFSGGGGLFSTAADYLQFCRALMAGGSLNGKRILNADSVAMMRKNQIGDLQLPPFRSLVPELATDNASLPGGLDKFGLGFAINTLPGPQKRDAYSMTWAGIYNTFFWIDPEKKVSAVLMTQLLPGLDPGPASTLKDFEKSVYDSLNK